jgi:predicted RNA-binding protein with PIN domain
VERSIRSFLAEGIQALACVAGIVGIGLGAAVLAPEPRAAAYPGEPMSAGEKGEPGKICLWLVDGFNVLQVGMLRGRTDRGWWNRARRSELISRVQHFREAGSEAEVWVVFDGPHPAERRGPGDPPHTGVVFAPSADEWIVARVREAGDPTRVAVVTADRRLAGRARHRGARVLSPGDFLARCG